MSGGSLTVKPIVVWFRQDLRLQDNPALKAAIEAGRPIAPVYILDDAGEKNWAHGGASRWWLHYALIDLSVQLKKYGTNLILRRGDSLEILKALLKEIGADSLYWNRRYEPFILSRDSSIKSFFSDAGKEVRSFNSSLLHEPHSITKKDGTPFKVFTPFWKHCLKKPKLAPIKVSIKKAQFLKTPATSECLESWRLTPDIGWDSGISEAWDPSIAGGKKMLKRCVSQKLDNYNHGRDILDRDATSRLSPYLHFGQIGPRQIWDVVAGVNASGTGRFLAEIGWREFSHHLMYHFPHSIEKPLRPEFEDFPWETDSKLLSIWQRGETGFPVVDAGMRQLWQTGWMHNRARMITASFLVKHLLQPWQEGARWFWDTLVDADLASNTQGWQWTAGCGADASPYYRVFNPILQGEKFDSNGDYVRRWVPELAKLPNSRIHKPWESDLIELAEAGVKLGHDYPFPIIAHSEGRARALKVYEMFKMTKK